MIEHDVRGLYTYFKLFLLVRLFLMTFLDVDLEFALFILWTWFLVSDLWLHLSCRPVRRSVGNMFSRVHVTPQPALSVGQSVTIYFFYDFISWTSLLLPMLSSDLKYGPCPPARDFGSRVSGLVFIKCGEKITGLKELGALGYSLGFLHFYQFLAHSAYK